MINEEGGPQCDISSIRDTDSGKSVCENALELCDDFESIYNFYKMHFCTFDDHLYFTIPVALVIIFICFYILGSTADNYLSPALAKISITLGLSESLAGVTLLALGNGAPDVITAIAASGDDEGIFLAVGSLMGGGLFISGIVSAVVMFASDKPIHLLGRTLTRDICFYLLALLVLLSASLTGELSLPFGIAFIAVYIAYVIYVVVQDKIDESQKKRRQSVRNTMLSGKNFEESISADTEDFHKDEALDEDAYFIYDAKNRIVDIQIHKVEDDNTYNDVFLLKKSFAARKSLHRSNTDSIVTDDSKRIESLDNTLKKKPTIQQPQSFESGTTNNEVLENSPRSPKLVLSLSDKLKKVKIDKSENLHALIDHNYIDDEEENGHDQEEQMLTNPKSAMNQTVKEYKVKVVWSMLKLKRIFIQGIEGEKPFKELNIIDKILFIFIDAPFDFLRRLTIPPGSEEQWNRRFAVISPIFCILWVYYATGIWDFASAPPISIYVCEAVAVILSFIIFFRTPLTRPPRRSLIVFSIVCFLISILWIFFIANVLVDLMNLLGLIIGLNPAFLGITILAAGLSMADLKVNAAVAKQGLARMALTGCFAGPMFNLLVGLGVSIIMSVATEGKATPFEFKDRDGLLPLMGVGALFIQLFLILTLSCIFKFYLKKPQAVIQAFYYLAAISLITVASFTFAK